MRRVLSAVIMLKVEAFGAIFLSCSKIVSVTLPEWLQNLPMILAAERINAYAFLGVVIICDEYVGPAFFKLQSCCHILAPHCIDGV